MKNIKLRVKNLIKKMGTADPFQIASALKIPIEYAELPPNINGYLSRPLRRKIIVINSKLNEYEIPIVICHELGHAMLHSIKGYIFHADTANFVNARNEYEANLFALYLLSYNYDIDNRLLNAAPLQSDIMTYREAHALLCHCIK